MHLELIFKKTINNKQMYSPRLYKYRDSYVLQNLQYTTHLWYGILTHTLLVQTHTYDVSAP